MTIRIKVAENLIAFKRAPYAFRENVSWSSACNSRRAYLITQEVLSSPAFLNFWDAGFVSRKVDMELLIPRSLCWKKGLLETQQGALQSDHQLPSHHSLALLSQPGFQQIPSDLWADFWHVPSLSFLWVRKFCLNPEELWWQERGSCLLSEVLWRSWGRDRRESEVFHLSGSPDPITPSLHIVVLVVVASGFIALVCLSLAVISTCPFLSSVFSSNWSPLPTLIASLPYLWLCLADSGSQSSHAVYPASMWQPSVISHSSHCQESLEGGLANWPHRNYPLILFLFPFLHKKNWKRTWAYGQEL